MNPFVLNVVTKTVLDGRESHPKRKEERGVALTASPSA
ncbi:hypothetical protein J2129_000745 [Methanofollis sp. W23]|nr:hypothetical protein [Methanofollis sp. W23]